MYRMTLNHIASALGSSVILPSDADASVCDRECEGVVIDSRLVEKDYIFIATKGERVDGHSFIDNVFEQGAIGVISEKVLDNPNGPYILVKDSFEALTKIATYYREMIKDRVKLVGITGSVGKTSTKEFIAEVLSRKYSVLKTNGNFNNEIGVPLTILRIKDEHQVAVVEMGINHFGEMSRLTAVAKPDYVVMTNIGVCHLENLIDRDRVLRAKSEIFEGLSIDGKAFLNGDDDKLITVTEVKGERPITFGLDAACDYTAKDIEDKGLKGSACSIIANNSSFNVLIPLPGKHMILNALAATAVAMELDVPVELIKKGIEECKSVGGRSNIINLEKYTLIDDCYNANPTSVKAAIDLLANDNHRKVAILGDMFELGADEATLHRETGEYAATKGIDEIICIGMLSKNTYEGAGGDNNPLVIYYETVDAFIDALKANKEIFIKDGDSILIKASHSMAFDIIVKEIQNI